MKSSSEKRILLSIRQTQCLFFICKGKTAKQTAREIGLSYRTIAHYVTNLKNRLGVYRRDHLVEIAILNDFHLILNARNIKKKTRVSIPNSILEYYY